MRFISAFSILLAAAAQVNAGLEAEQAALAETPNVDVGVSLVERDQTFDEILQKRDCDYNGCKCNSRGKQFHSCGNCYWISDGSWVISKKRVANHIYECSPSGNCCDYGYAKDCGKTGARCGRTD